MTEEELEREKWDAVSQVYPPDVGGPIGTFIAVFAQATFLGLIIAVTSPIWVPFAIRDKIKSILKPEPRFTHRGTVRPLVPIPETAPRKAHAR